MISPSVIILKIFFLTQIQVAFSFLYIIISNDQLTNRQTDQLAHHLIDQLTNRQTDQLVHHVNDQLTNRQTGQPAHHLTDQQRNQLVFHLND